MFLMTIISSCFLGSILAPKVVDSLEKNTWCSLAISVFIISVFFLKTNLKYFSEIQDFKKQIKEINDDETND